MDSQMTNAQMDGLTGACMDKWKQRQMDEHMDGPVYILLGQVRLGWKVNIIMVQPLLYLPDFEKTFRSKAKKEKSCNVTISMEG